MMGRKGTRFIQGFPGRLQEAIEKRGITYAELGRLLGVDKKTIYNWKEGICSPDIILLDKMCSVLNVSVQYLMYGEK